MSSGSILIFLFFLITTIAALDPSFYNATCPDAVSTVQAEVAKIVAKEARMAASILRLHFHDCFVQGCDASILLDETPTIKSEKTAAPNNNSARGFESIDQIKAKLEDICPGVVSCADILALAARDGVVALGGPTWEVQLGRRDSTTASFDGANNDLPGPGLALADLLKSFEKKGFTAEEMVTLSGAHTIGFSQCRFFRRRIYNESDIDAAYARSLRTMCPAEGGDSNLSPFGQSSSVFDNEYYRDVVKERGLLHSDQQLVAEERVKKYSTNSNSFFTDFGNAMIKMGSLSPLTGSQGQVRRSCRVVN